MNSENFFNLMFIVLTAIVIVVLGYLVFNYNLTKTTPILPNPTQRPSDFNLIFRYGVYAKNELNTFNQTYTKDMVTDPSIKTDLKLTDDELGDIYKKLNDLDLFNESTKPLENNVVLTPCSSYFLKVQINYKQKDLSWSDCQGEVGEKFYQFKNHILRIIESKEEYKKLPTSNSGYL